MGHRDPYSPDDFSRRYGSYALHLLEGIKFGFPLREKAIPSIKNIDPFRISREGQAGVKSHKTTSGDIAAGIDEVIKFLRPSRTSSRRAFE
ncbi:hypothetical protein BGX24_010785 [Mortierella sp. AD032]|nr:hypothetical protein BGX24_010785 [Mortierella sp. AD032]